MQWITITSIVSCYVPHVVQHVAVSLFGPLNQIMISSALSAETGFAYLDLAYQDTQVSVWSFLLQDGLVLVKSSVIPSLKILGELSTKTMNFPCTTSFGKRSSKLLDEWPTKAVEPHLPAWEQDVLITWYSSRNDLDLT